MKKESRSWWAPTLVFALVVPFTLQAGADDDLKPVASVEGITEYRLENGLQVLLFPDRSKQTVTVNATYFVGSRHEGRGEKGMAHLLEHMVFKGTPSNPDIWKALEDHGARFNGTTWVDRTNYYETLPTTDPANLEWALRMEADRMVNSNIAQEDLSKEFSVVRNEFEMGENNPTGILMQRMMSAAYLWHNYGDSTIGNRSDIERVPATSLKKFYKKYYQPDNAMLVVAGDFDPAPTLALIRECFGAIPKPERKLEGTYTVEPVQDGARHVELRRVGDVAACGSAYHISSASHADYPALDVIENILTHQPSGRLYKALVESGMSASVFGVAFGWRDPGLALHMASVRLDSPIEPVMAKMNEIIEGFASTPVTDAEVNRAKNRLLKNIELSMKNSGRIGVQFSEWAAAGDWRLFFLHRDRLESLTTEQVQRVATKYFKPSNRTSGIFHPTRDADRTTVPQAPNVLALVRDFKGKEALSEGEAFEATPENIERRVKRETLPGGIKLALLPKETRGDSVSATLTLRFGSERDIKGRKTALGLVPQMLMRGSEKHSYQQIQDKLDELKASVNIYGGGGMTGAKGSVNASIRTDREHLPAVIDLVGELLRHPTFPTDEFEIVKKEGLAGLEEQLSDPRALGFTSVLRRMNPRSADDVRYIPTVEESVELLKNVDVEDVRNIHKDLYGASNATVTVVGDFDEAAVTAAIKRALGNWKSPKPFRRIVNECATDVDGSIEIIQTPDKKMALVACVSNVPLRDDAPDYPAMHLADYILGASAKSRLLNRLRHKEGLSYGASSAFIADSEDEYALFMSMGICAPQNADKAYAAMIDEIKKLVNDGVGVEELEESKASFAMQVKNRLANDASVARMLNDGLHHGRTMQFYKDMYEKIANLSQDEIRQAMQKHIQPDRLIGVKAGDLQIKAVD